MAEITENSVPERTPRCIRRNAVLYTLGRAGVLMMALLTAADLVCVYLRVGTETAIGLMIPRMGAMLGYNGAGGGCCGLSDRCVCGICGGGTGGCSVRQKFWLEHCILGNFFRGYAGGCVAVRRIFVQPRIFAVVPASCRGGNIPCSGGRLRAQSEKCEVRGARCAAPCSLVDFLTVKRRQLLRGITVKSSCQNKKERAVCPLFFLFAYTIQIISGDFCPRAPLWEFSKSRKRSAE